MLFHNNSFGKKVFVLVKSLFIYRDDIQKQIVHAIRIRETSDSVSGGIIRITANGSTRITENSDYIEQ